MIRQPVWLFVFYSREKWSCIFLFIYLRRIAMTTYHNCRYFFKKSNQSEDMKICINYRWNLKIKSIQTIKFSFILSIQNPRQLPYIIVNINLSIIFFSCLLLYTKFGRVFNFSFDCSPFDVVHFVHRVSNVFWFHRILFFPFRCRQHIVFFNTVIDFLCPIN